MRIFYRFLFVLTFLLFVSSFFAFSAHAQQAVCGLCPIGTDRAGLVPEFGLGGNGACNLYALPNSNAVFCNQDCTYLVTPTTCYTPVINQIPNATVNQGDTYSYTGSFTDNYTNSWTGIADYGDGTAQSIVLNQDRTFSLSHVYQKEGVYTVTVTITDSFGAQVVGAATVTVNNLPPVLGLISGPNAPVVVNSAVFFSTGFTYSGSATHAAVWNWGDGTTSPGVITESGGSGSIAGTHTYTTSGVYTVNLTLTDSNGNSVSSPLFQYVVVYDPSAGFVTGGGTIMSPVGAYTLNTSLTGKANFGFNSKYQNGASVPNGNTEFNFTNANMHFQSTAYQWLVISGAKAQYKGSGTINGAGNFSFILTAVDGELPGGGGQDKFRIKIWDNSTGSIVYDNQMGADDSSTPSTVIDSGSITIHQ